MMMDKEVRNDSWYNFASSSSSAAAEEVKERKERLRVIDFSFPNIIGKNSVQKPGKAHCM